MTTTQVITQFYLNSGLSNNNKDDSSHKCVLSKNALMTAQKELREDGFIREQALQQLKQRVERNNQLINIKTDDNFLLRFLRVKKFNVPMAEHMLIKYLNFRQSLQHLTFNMDYKEDKVYQLLNDGYIFVSPIRDCGRRVIITVAEKFDPEKYTQEIQCKLHSITYETLLLDEETQIMGVTHIADMKNVSMSQVASWSPHEAAVILKIGEQALPMRHKAIHVLNMPVIMKFLYDFAKERLSPKMATRAKVHNSVQQLNQHIDPQCLPKEYGGTIPMAEMIEMWKKELEESRERLMTLDKMKSLVPIRRRNTNFREMEGSFKRLEVD